MNLPPCTDAILQTLRHLRKKGLSYSEVAAEMNRRGIPGDRGGIWTGDVVKHIFGRKGTGE